MSADIYYHWDWHRITNRTEAQSITSSLLLYYYFYLLSSSSSSSSSSSYTTNTMLGGILVTTAWRVLKVRMEERPPAMEGRCEYIEKQPRSNDKG
jgi:hypothetical protein